MHGSIKFLDGTVSFESGLEKIFAIMMAIDPQVTEIVHQPMTFKYRVTSVARELTYTPDYRVKRNLDRPWIWGSSLKSMPVDCLYEVKPQEVLEKIPLQTAGAQRSLLTKVQEDDIFGFHIFTNQSIPRFQLENVTRVGNARPTPEILNVGLECLGRLKSGSSIELPELAEDIAASGIAPIPAILSLMKQRYIAGQYHQPDFLDREALIIDA
jgi:hypothetical protein